MMAAKTGSRRCFWDGRRLTTSSLSTLQLLGTFSMSLSSSVSFPVSWLCFRIFCSRTFKSVALCQASSSWTLSSRWPIIQSYCQAFFKTSPIWPSWRWRLSSFSTPISQCGISIWCQPSWITTTSRSWSQWDRLTLLCAQKVPFCGTTRVSQRLSRSTMSLSSTKMKRTSDSPKCTMQWTTAKLVVKIRLAHQMKTRWAPWTTFPISTTSIQRSTVKMLRNCLKRWHLKTQSSLESYSWHSPFVIMRLRSRTRHQRMGTLGRPTRACLRMKRPSFILLTPSISNSSRGAREKPPSCRKELKEHTLSSYFVE